MGVLDYEDFGSETRSASAIALCNVTKVYWVSSGSCCIRLLIWYIQARVCAMARTAVKYSCGLYQIDMFV